MNANEYPKVYLYKRVVQAKMFIDKNYADPLDLSVVSDEAAFSKFHFIRLFKKIYGMTPHIYLRKVRLEHARKLLEQGFSVLEACNEVGFESIGSFTTLFKRMNGLAPSAYRQLRMNHQHQIVLRPIQFVPHCFALSNGWKKKSNFEEVH